MEGLIALVVVAMASALIVAPVLAIIAIVKASRIRQVERRTIELSQRLSRLEVGLRSLARRLDATDGASPEREPEAAPRAPTAEAPQPAPPAPVPVATPPKPEPPPPPVVPPGAAPPRVAAPSPPPPPAPPVRPAIDIDWERWIGVRGAALIGSIALALAGLLFFKYSIDRGLITPTMRVFFGIVTGLGCLIGSGWLRRREYVHTAEGLAGAGVVVLYASFWAAHVLYGLIGMFVAFGLMLLVTVVCCLLAVRRESLVVAVLGLVGGFATPLLLTGGTDRPIGLFGYVLLLDLGLLVVGHKRRWPSLGILSLLGTVLLQAIWFGNRLGPDSALLGLAILAVFAALFVFAYRPGGAVPPGGVWLWTRVGAILFPFAFAVYFASRVELGPHLYPLALLLALLCAAAAWLAREQRRHSIGTGAATASVAVVAVWWLQQTIDPALAWELAAVTVGLSIVFHFFVERDPEPPGIVGPAPAAMIALAGFAVLLVCAAATARVPLWPWLAGGAGLTLLTYRHAGFPGRGFLQLGVAVGFGLGFSVLHLSSRPLLPPAWLFFAVLVAVSVVLQLAAWRRTGPALRATANQAAALLPVLLLVGLAPSAYPHQLAPLPALGTALILGLLAVLAATRLGRGAWYAAAVGATLLSDVGWTVSRSGLARNPAEALEALILLCLTVVLFTVWPFFVARRFADQRSAWYSAALASPLWFLALRDVFESSFGDGFVGLLPVALGALSLACALRVRHVFHEPSQAQRAAVVSFAAAALCFLAVAIPLQLDKQWVTIGWALQGLAVIALWRNLDHPGLKYFAFLLLGAATLRLVANPALLGYYPRSSVRLVNWLLYTYLVPAGALLASGILLRPLEAGRARAWERELYSRGHAVGAAVAGLAAILVTFVWINLAIADWFATGTILTLSFGDRPAQRLTVSIAWATYALVLLGVGMARDSLGLRWLSLGFLLVTIGKVFLYDLGALQDLYRVASLVGLAASLILVSLLYQRLVFRRSGAQSR